MKSNIFKLLFDNKVDGTSIKFEADGQDSKIYLYDIIGGDFFGGISAKSFIEQLDKVKGNVLHIHINSPGGDVFEGKAISSAIELLSSSGIKTIAHIDALCASAATIIALSCDEVRMSEGAFFMIHNTWTYAYGNANDLDELSALLRKLDSSAANKYTNKTGSDIKQVKKWMDAETWFTASEALDAKFIDFIDSKPEAKNQAKHWNLSAYRNAPVIDNDDEQKIKLIKQNMRRRLDLLVS